MIVFCDDYDNNNNNSSMIIGIEPVGKAFNSARFGTL